VQISGFFQLCEEEEEDKKDGINMIYYDKHTFLKRIAIRITNSTKLMMGCQKSHLLPQAHNLVQRCSLRRQCKQHQNKTLGEVKAPIEGKRKSAKV
jgi:hypothetical protein